MDKTYNKIVFVNNQEPDLDATNMNAISNAIDEIDNRVIALNETVEQDSDVIAQHTEAIAQNTEDIESLKKKPSGITLTSASPLENSAAAGIAGLQAKGKSEQDVSPNLIIPTAKSDVKNTVTITASYTDEKLNYVELSGTCTENATYYVSTGLMVLPSGTYTLSGCPNGGSSSTFRLGLNDGTTRYWDSGNGQTFTLTEQKTCDVRIALYGGQTYSNLKFYPMLVSGSIVKPYEPYTGAPTPTNPIAIVDASGVIEAHTINLFDKSNVSAINNCSIGTAVIDGSGTLSTSSNVKVLYIKCKPNTTYTISKDVADYCACGFTSELPKIGSVYRNMNSNREVRTTTVTSAADSKYMIIYPAKASIIASGITYDMIYQSLQVEEGLTASEYVAYQSSEVNLSSIGIDLKSVGNVKDELIVKPDGSGEWVQKVGVEIVNSSIGLNLSGWGNQTNTVAVYWSNNGINPNNANVYAMADKLKGVSRDYGATTDEEAICMSGSSAPYSPAMRILKSRISDWSESDSQSTKISKIKNWLESNPITMYYPLATPIIHTLTAEQVAAILALQTYAGTTIVESELDEVVVDYVGDTKAYIDSKFEYLYELIRSYHPAAQMMSLEDEPTAEEEESENV